MHTKTTLTVFAFFLTQACNQITSPQTDLGQHTGSGSLNPVGTPLNKQKKNNPTNPTSGAQTVGNRDATAGNTTAPSSSGLPAANGTNPQASTGKHVADVGANPIFIASCRSKVTGPGGGTYVLDPNGLTANGRAAHSVWTKLVNDGSVKYCQESFVSDVLEPQEKEQSAQAIKNVCMNPGDVFSLQTPCDAPETGVQNLITTGGMTGLSAGIPSNIKRYYNYLRSTYSASGVPSADKEILKKGAGEIFRIPLGQNFLTPDIQ